MVPDSREEARPPRLRSLNRPRPVRVRTDGEGLPTAVALRKSRWRRVARVRERWRIDDEWWRRPISRVYHALVLDDGRLVTVYRDRADGGWYAHEG